MQTHEQSGGWLKATLGENLAAVFFIFNCYHDEPFILQCVYTTPVYPSLSVSLRVS